MGTVHVGALVRKLEIGESDTVEIMCAGFDVRSRGVARCVQRYENVESMSW